LDAVQHASSQRLELARRKTQPLSEGRNRQTFHALGTLAAFDDDGA
jgi:hypothetical protein